MDRRVSDTQPVPRSSELVPPAAEWSGIATGGSNTTAVDILKNFAVDQHLGAVVEVTHLGITYTRACVSNTATTLTIDPLPAGILVAKGDQYVIKNPSVSLAAALLKLIPKAKARVFNTALPVAEAGWLGTAITPTSSPSYIRIYVCVSVAGVLRVARTVGGVTIVENLNGGTNLVAGAAYMFTIPWRSGDSINIRYSVTGGTINTLDIDEIGAAE